MIQAFEERKYRVGVFPEGLVSFGVRAEETDMLVSAARDLRGTALSSVKEARRIIKEYASRHPGFMSSLEPMDAERGAPELIRDMCAGASACGVGPMASVAGAVAEYAGRRLMDESEEVILENGGDIFIKTLRNRLVGIHAGNSALSGRLALEVSPEDTPCGICSSSGTVGHSLNFGAADAVVVISRSVALADAAATACSNMVKDEGCIGGAIEFVRSVRGVDGAAVIVNGRFGAWGGIKIKG